MADDPIKHVVLLIFENGSFDRSLGCFQSIYPELDGIPASGPKRSNVDKDGGIFYQEPTDAIQMPRDPHHEHVNVMNQIKNANSGFVEDFSRVYPDSTPQERQLIMSYYPLGGLPALHALAKEFRICDQWFSSLPGPTWPNRFFALSGTSNGLVVMPSTLLTGRMLFEESQPTLFSRLTEKKIKWRVYYHDVPCSLILHQQLTEEARTNYYEYEKFSELCAGPEEDFPEFVFIEPKYFGVDQNDDHPPHNVMKAQKLIADVFNKLRKSKAWDSTLFVITYDEHGGFYDHVPPPKTAIPPRYVLATDEYEFDQYGVRVPTVLVSPWVNPGVDKTQFDHTSLLKYLKEKWHLGDLGARVDAATSVLAALNVGGSPRTNTIDQIPFDDSLTQGGDLQLEAKPTGHHLAVDAALAIMGDDAALEVISDVAEFSRTGKCPGWKLTLFKFLGRFIWEMFAFNVFDRKARRDKKIARLKKTLGPRKQ